MIQLRNVCTAAAALLTLTACTSTQPAARAKAPAPQMAKTFEFKNSQTLKLNYLLFLPAGYEAAPDKRWPLMLFLHGAGERGSDVWKVATHGPPKNITGHPDFPFILVSPQCPDGQIWSNDELLALLDSVTKKYRVDTHRAYLTGLSMGGFGAWNLALAHPERFAAVVPICGGGSLITFLYETPQNAGAYKTLAIWAFHGARDPIVPVDESKRMVALAQRMGVQEVKLTIYPEAQHDAWTETYKNPELYQWLLEHKR